LALGSARSRDATPLEPGGAMVIDVSWCVLSSNVRGELRLIHHRIVRTLDHARDALALDRLRVSLAFEAERAAIALESLRLERRSTPQRTIRTMAYAVDL
jgi:hypothetical protein